MGGMKNNIWKNGGIWWYAYSFTGPHRCKTRFIRGCPDPCPRKGQGIHKCRSAVQPCPRNCPQRGQVEQQRARKSSKSTKKADAEALLAKATLAKRTGRVIIDERAETFDMMERRLAQKYEVTYGHAPSHLKHLREFFMGVPAIAITTDRVTQYELHRLSQGAKRATVNNELAMLRRMFRLAVKAGVISAMPVIEIPDPDNARKGFVEREDFDSIRQELPDYAKAVFTFMYFTAWRRSEVLGLTWNRVDLKAGTVRLDTSKNGDQRVFPFGAFPELAALLRAQREHTSRIEKQQGKIIPKVFHRDGQSLRHEWFYKAWHEAVQRAAGAGKEGKLSAIQRPHLLGLIPHDLRRSAVRNLVRAGVARSIAMQLTGHKTESVFSRYDIVDMTDLEAAVAKVAKYVTPKPQLEKAGGE